MSNGTDEPFLSRWSRRKAQVRQDAATTAQPLPEPPVVGASEAAALPARIQNTADEGALPANQAARVNTDRLPAATPVPPPTLDEVNALTPASDFTRFVAPGVDAEVKNAAMKKLFADPHFNVMDGLDTYIEDYGRADPIPKAILRQMVQARVLGLLDDELEEQPVPTDAVAQLEAGPPGTVDAQGTAPDRAHIEASPDPATQEPPPLPTERAATLEPPAA